jgi:hypothetical protein
MKGVDHGLPIGGYRDKHFEMFVNITENIMHHSDDPWLTEKRN